MPFPKASRALERFTVLDLTRVRSGPTCVRQLADWGANVIKIELPPEPGGGEPLGGPREGSDFQNLHRNKRSMTLNLKAPEAVAAFKRMVKKADVVVENFRPDVKRRLGIDYRATAQDQSEADLCQHFRVRPDRSVCRPAGLRPDRAGHGRPDVDHRLARAGAGARRHPGRRPHRRPVLRARHPGGAARARKVEAGPACHDLAAAGADLHARLPGRALADRGRGAQAGRQQSSDQHPDRRVQDRRRPHQHRHPPGRRSGSGSAPRPMRRAAAAAGISDGRRALEEPRRAQRRDRELYGQAARAPNGSSASTRPACRAGRSTRSTRSSPTRRSSISAWRRP